MILGDGTLGRGINLATIPEAHKGRGYLEAGGYLVGVRTARLWGKCGRIAWVKVPASDSVGAA